MCGITSRVHRKRLGKYGDLERLLASVVLSPLGDARGVVVRQHFCERRRVSFVGCKDLSPGLVGVDVEKSKRMAPLVSGTGVKSAMGERAQPRRYTSAWAMRSQCDHSRARKADNSPHAVQARPQPPGAVVILVDVPVATTFVETVVYSRRPAGLLC